ncbi:MAG: hypothetical protein AAF485_13280 [Chloroflexota bacterium]
MADHIDQSKTVEQLSPEKRAMLYGFKQLIAYELVEKRRSRKAVVEHLVTRGIPRTAAKQFVDEIAPKVLRKDKQSRRKSYGGMMIGGFVVMLFGIAATAATYLLSVNLGGSTYLLFYGAIGSGLIAFSLGFVSWFVNLF